MKNHIELAIEILTKELNSIGEDDEFDKEMGETISETRQDKRTIKRTKILDKINDFKEGNYSVEYSLKEKSEKTQILDTYFTQSLEWFGSADEEDIEQTSLNISEKYNISLYDSLRIVQLADDLMMLNLKVTCEPKMKRLLEDRNDDTSKNFKNKETIQSEIKTTEDKILFILDKKRLSESEYANKYISSLERFRTDSKGFGKFLDFLVDSRDYGVISSFCESNWDDYGKYRCAFENETIDIKDFR